MIFKRLIIPIAIFTLLTLALYWLIASRLLLDPPETTPSPGTSTNSAEITKTEVKPVVTTESELPPVVTSSLQNSTSQGSTRLVEIFGRVLDRELQPVDDVFITEERYFFNTRSDAEGNYRISMSLPTHRYPTLNFLRHKFNGKRISLTKELLQQKRSYELNVTLEDNPDTVKLSGWVGNELGVALEGARVELNAQEAFDGESFYLTVFSDPGGNFQLDGVRVGEKYRLSVNLAPEYPVFLDPDFSVSLNPQPLNIELKSLKFVDIDGMMMNREAAPVSDFEIYVSNVTTGVHSAKIVSDSSGFFSLKHFPVGEISLATRGSVIYEITGLVLTANEYQNLQLTIDRGNHNLAGWIRGQNGIVPQRAMVTLDQTFHEGSVRYHQYRSQATDIDGRFTFSNLGSGEYRITTYAQGYQKQELMHRLRNQSDEVQVTLQRLDN
jgi:hypothetical protein